MKPIAQLMILPPLRVLSVSTAAQKSVERLQEALELFDVTMGFGRRLLALQAILSDIPSRNHRAYQPKGLKANPAEVASLRTRWPMNSNFGRHSAPKAAAASNRQRASRRPPCCPCSPGVQDDRTLLHHVPSCRPHTLCVPSPVPQEGGGGGGTAQEELIALWVGGCARDTLLPTSGSPCKPWTPPAGSSAN